MELMDASLWDGVPPIGYGTYAIGDKKRGCVKILTHPLFDVTIIFDFIT